MWPTCRIRAADGMVAVPGPGTRQPTPASCTPGTTLHLRYEREVADLLGLPGQVRQGALVPTAYHTGETFSPAARQPVAEVLHVNGW